MNIKTFAKILATFQTLGCSFAIPEANPIPENKVAPVQHRLAFSGDSGMVVSWNTYEELNNPSVQYGLVPDSLDQTAYSDESVTYQTSVTWNNHVKLSGLQPSTTYYYKVANSNDSEIYSFTTAKSAGTTQEFSFSVVVDMGTMGPLGLSDKVGKGAEGALSPGERNTIQSLQANMDEFEFLLHPGDIAYADYWLKEEIQGYLPNTTIADGYKVYELILNEFYEELQPITAKKPYMVGPGNHEADCDNGGVTDKANKITYTNSICMPGQTNFTGFKNHFRMPSDMSRGEGNFWYSFDYGLVHFVQFNTETDFGNGLKGPEDAVPNGNQGIYANQQIDFLEQDLASVNRTKTPWVVALGHRPWYVAGLACDTCQEAFENVLAKYNVDVIIAGHVHNYERQAPVYNGTIDPNGLDNPSYPWYILNGIAGHYDGIDELVYPLPDYTVFAQDTAYGWSKFTVHNCTHLTHEFISSSNDTVLDRATLFKNRTCVDNLAISPSSNYSSSIIGYGTSSEISTGVTSSCLENYCIEAITSEAITSFEIPSTTVQSGNLSPSSNSSSNIPSFPGSVTEENIAAKFEIGNILKFLLFVFAF